MAQPLSSATDPSRASATEDRVNDEANDAAESQANSLQGGGTEPSRLLPWLLLLFVGSGCAALIYEIVWLQLLQLVIGLTTASLGVLLGTFMGGMCLGSLLLPRLVSAGRHPLRVYACLELGIGLIGVGVLFGMPYVGQIYATHGGHGFAAIFLRGTLAALCLLPPTLLMGSTLPAISRWVQATPQGVSWLGFFYGGNIAGAVFGCLLAGFYLLRVHDMATATYVAASINAAVALVAFVLATLIPHRSRQAASLRDSRREEDPLGKSEIRNPKSEIEKSLRAPAVEPGTEKREQDKPGSWAVYVTIALSGLTARDVFQAGVVCGCLVRGGMPERVPVHQAPEARPTAIAVLVDHLHRHEVPRVATRLRNHLCRRS
jgi:spermidine synthase